MSVAYLVLRTNLGWKPCVNWRRVTRATRAVEDGEKHFVIHALHEYGGEHIAVMQATSITPQSLCEVVSHALRVEAEEAFVNEGPDTALAERFAILHGHENPIIQQP